MERPVISEQLAMQTQTETIAESDVTDSGTQDIPTVRLCLRKPRSNKKVQWTQGTVDNEHMNKKKSKCCCIYEKPRSFGESSSEDSDDECEHCHGHKDAHKKILKLNAGTAKEEITPSAHQSKNGSEDSDDKCDSCHGCKGAHKKILKVNRDTPKEEIVPLAPESIANVLT